MTTPTYTVPRNRLRVSATAGALIALAISLTACTDDPAQVTTPTGETTTASTPSTPAPPEPTRPVEEATPASAIQFTRYFWDLYNYAYQTYDTSPLKAISDPACTYCASTTKTIAALQKQGTTVEGYIVSVRSAASPPVKITTGTIVELVLDQSPGQTVPESGKGKTLVGIKNLRATVGIAWLNGQWAIQGVDVHKGSGTAWPA